MDRRFTLLRPLASGAMGSVWTAEQRATGRTVAIKLMSQELLHNEVALVRFRREARTAAQLRSRHIVQILDYDVDPALGPFIAMELLDGESLYEKLSRHGPMPPSEVALIVRQIARALTHAHGRGVVHRDVKPANVFLQAEEQSPELVKVLDFGLARAPLTDGLPGTQRGCVIGTFTHMSPEQVRGDVADHRSDLWALGVVAFECMTGQIPFPGNGPAEFARAICKGPIPVPSRFRVGVPDGFDGWIRRALERDPERRFQDAAEMASALESVCDGEGLYVTDKETMVGPVTGSLLGPTWTACEPSRHVGATIPAGSADPTGQETVDLQGNYYLTDGDTTVGPMTATRLLRDLRERNLPPHALVWKEGWTRWRPLREVFPGAWDA